MITLTRQDIQRMNSGRGNAGSGGSGGASVDLSGYMTIEQAQQQFVSIDFFKRLFQAHGTDENDDPVDVDPNDTETTITDIEAIFGFWTEQYLSALGNGGGGGTGGATALTDLVDVALNNPTNGQALVYNATTGKWTNQTISGGGTDMATVWANLAAATNEQINASHLTNALSGYAQASALANYLPIAGGTVTGNLSVGGTIAVTGAATLSSSVTAGSFIKSGGTSSQFLKADGSVDSNTYATQTWVGENYISIAFFKRLFQAHGTDENDDPVDVDPNDTETTITDIEAMFGFWTEQYLSALGNGGGGGTGGATALTDLVDVAVSSPTNGQALVYNSTSGKWTNQTIGGGGTDMATVWSNLAAATNEQINASHLTNALSGYATSSDLTGYLPLTAGSTKALTGQLYWDRSDTTYRIIAYDPNRVTRYMISLVYSVDSTTNIMTADMTLNSYAHIVTTFVPANSEGYQRFTLGNTNKLNAANNMYGIVRMAGQRNSDNASASVYFGSIVPDVLTATRTWTMPDKTGTVALVDDVSGAFTSLTSTNATNLSVTIGGTTKTLTDVYAYQAKNVRPFSMAAGDDYDTLSGYTLTRGCFVAMNYNSLTTNDVTLADLGTYDTLVSFGYNQRIIQLKGNAYGTAKLKYRRVYQPSSGVYAFSPWKELAFADGNIATATALATARTLWGQSFDGTANVSGSMTGVGAFTQSGAINMQGSTASYCQGIRLHPVSGASSIFFGCDVDSGMTAGMFGITHNATGLRIRGQASTTSTSLVDYLTVAYGGNVGIGTSSPSYLLHVNGQAAAQTFRSTVETGTAPMVVASSTLVTNLNADLLDGKHSTDFAAASDVTTLQGYFDSSGAANKAVQLKTSRTLWGQSFDGTGNVTGAMTSVGSITLTNNSRISNATGSGGSLYIGRSDDAGWVKISDMCSRQGDSYWKIKSNGDGTFGNVYSNGAVTALSDARHKTIVGDVDLTVEQIAAMPAIRYRWNERKDNGLYVGSIAQDWQTILPEVVMTSDDEQRTLSLSYGVAALIASITTARKVVNHEERIAQLERENQELKNELNKIKAA